VEQIEKPMKPVRARFTEAFVGDVAKVWDQHGARVLEQMAVSDPSKFADLCSRLIPRDVSMKLEHQQNPANMSHADWSAVTGLARAIKQELSEEGAHLSPEAVCEYVSAAIRAYSTTKKLT
jgi:hypothetical protein